MQRLEKAVAALIAQAMPRRHGESAVRKPVAKRQSGTSEKTKAIEAAE